MGFFLSDLFPEIDLHSWQGLTQSWLFRGNGSFVPFQPLPQQTHPSRGPQVHAGGSMEVGWNLLLDFLHAILEGFGGILGIFPIAGDPRA